MQTMPESRRNPAPDASFDADAAPDASFDADEPVDPEAEAPQEEEAPEGAGDPTGEPPPEMPAEKGPVRSRAEQDALVRTWMRDAKLQRALGGVLRKAGITKRLDVEDILQVAYAVAAAGPVPDDADALRAYLVGVARNKGVDLARTRRDSLVVVNEKKARRAASAVDGYEHRDVLRALERHVPAGQSLAWSCLVRTAMGEKLTDLADEHDIEYETLAKRVKRLRVTLAGVGMLAVLLVFGLLRRTPSMPGDVAPELMPLEPAISTHVEQPDALERARAIRARAFAECMHNAWGRCLEDLDVARGLDPDGDNSSAAQAARQDAEESEAHMKPDGWIPKGKAVYGPAAR